MGSGGRTPTTQMATGGVPRRWVKDRLPCRMEVGMAAPAAWEEVAPRTAWHSGTTSFCAAFEVGRAVSLELLPILGVELRLVTAGSRGGKSQSRAAQTIGVPSLCGSEPSWRPNPRTRPAWLRVRGRARGAGGRS